MMRAVRFHGRGDVRLDRVPVPRGPGPGEVRVGVAWTGVCGTDREEWRHGPLFIPAGAPHPVTGRLAPITMGHEVGRTDLPGVKVLVSAGLAPAAGVG